MTTLKVHNVFGLTIARGGGVLISRHGHVTSPKPELACSATFEYDIMQNVRT